MVEIPLYFPPVDGDLPDEDTLRARMRYERDRLLAASDYTMLPDVPTDKAAWTTYREALRLAPDDWTPGPVWEAPDPPPYTPST